MEDSGLTRLIQTDGVNLFYNSEAVSALDDEELIYVLGITAHYVIEGTAPQRRLQEISRWARACYYVSALAMESLYQVGRRPSRALFEERFKGMTVDEVYRDLDVEGGNESLYSEGGLIIDETPFLLSQMFETDPVLNRLRILAMQDGAHYASARTDSEALQDLDNRPMVEPSAVPLMRPHLRSTPPLQEYLGARPSPGHC